MEKEILYCLGKIANSMSIIHLMILHDPSKIDSEFAEKILSQIEKVHLAKDAASSLIQASEKLNNLKEV